MSVRRPPPTAGVPDFGEVLRRAQELDPDVISDASVAEARRITEETGPIVLTSAVDHPEPALAPFIASAQRRIGALISQEARREPPPLPAPGASRVGGVAALVGLAAAAILILSMGMAVRGPLRPAAEPQPPPAPAEAARSAADWTEVEETVPRVPPPPKARGKHRAAAPPPPPAIPSLDPTPTPTATPPEEPAAQPVAAKPNRRDSLRELDAQAQAAWGRGDLRGAERVFETIVRRGGRSSWAELAYGDLFTIAHQRGDRSQEARLWRRYIRKFPRGRFADGVRASLCRRGSGDQAVACWKAYLSSQPKGRHRAEATRRLAVGH